MSLHYVHPPDCLRVIIAVRPPRVLPICSPVEDSVVVTDPGSSPISREQKSGTDGWCVILPVRPFAQAKSRLAQDLPELREELARAFACDVFAAVAASELVASVVIVGENIPGADGHPNCTHLVGPAGLNPSLHTGEQWSRAAGFTKLAVLTADLPAATTFDIDAVLQQADLQVRAFVADAAGTGTSMLTTTGPPLDPQFGVASAALHRSSGATRLTASPSIRLDVDTAEGLQAALQMGVGSATTRVLEARRIPHSDRQQWRGGRRPFKG